MIGRDQNVDDEWFQINLLTPSGGSKNNFESNLHANHSNLGVTASHSSHDSHINLWCTLEQKTDTEGSIHTSFVSRYPNMQHKIYHQQFGAVVWAVERFKQYVLVKDIAITTDHHNISLASDGYISSKSISSD